MKNVVDIAQKLVTFRSTHTNPEGMDACLAYCKSLFKDLPIAARTIEYDGVKTLVISNKDTTDFDVLLVGHVDTVDGADELFAGTIKDQKLYGRGTLDMKAFVATSLVVVRDLIAENFSGSIGVAVVTDEELGGARGARHLVEDLGYQADTVLVPDDGESLHRIIAKTKHIMHIKCTATGKEAHACRPWNGKNAIASLMETYQSFSKVFEKLQPAWDGDLDNIWVNTQSLGTISGGVATNEVPEHAEMSIDIRIVPPTTKEEVLAILKEVAVEGVEVEVLLEAPPTALEDDEVLGAYIEAIEKVTGKKPELVGAAGGTDARYFAYAGMRAIVHQGGGGDAQSADEHVFVDDLETLVPLDTFEVGQLN